MSLLSWLAPLGATRVAALGCIASAAQAQSLQLYSAFGTAATQPSTADAPSKPARKADGKPSKAPGPKAPASSSKSPSKAPATPERPYAQHAASVAASHLAPSRLRQFSHDTLTRELMLKLQPRTWQALPRLHSVTLTIRSSETQVERDVADKHELLLYLLALEQLTGRPATFVPPPGIALPHQSTRAVGVTVTLSMRDGPDAVYGFLERLVHIILPNQVGFEGVAPPVLVPPPTAKPEAANVGVGAVEPAPAVVSGRVQLRKYGVEIKVPSLLQYPDFEQNFAVFGAVSGVRVRVLMEGASAADCGVLLSGLSLPLLSGAAAEAALAAQAAEAAMERRVKRL